MFWLLAIHNAILGITKDSDKQKPGLQKLHDFTKNGTTFIDRKIRVPCNKNQEKTIMGSHHIFLKT